MAYGTPERPDDVEPYFTHIRGGRTPSRASVEKLKRRYEIVGGRTPLLEITQTVQQRLEKRLNATSAGEPYRVYVGMKHWHPFIGDVMGRIVDDGVSELAAIALAPHYSHMSIGGYRKAVDDAVSRSGAVIRVRMLNSWHTHPGFISLIADRMQAARARWSTSEQPGVVTVFSAHSLPARIRTWNDPYEEQLLESCHAVATRAHVDNWRFAWQSAGETGEPWLGPDISEVIEQLHLDGVRHVMSVPFGFVTDNLEILYDIDVVAKAKADVLGLTMRRIELPNADPAFIGMLADLVGAAFITTDTSVEQVA